jgi:hypothetical protein
MPYVKEMFMFQDMNYFFRLFIFTMKAEMQEYSYKPCLFEFLQVCARKFYLNFLLT